MNRFFRRFRAAWERVVFLKNWPLFVWPLSRLPGRRIAKLRNGAKFILRDKADFAMLLDIAGRDGLAIASFDGVSSIADIGAHIGIFVVLVGLRNPEARLVAIEPEESNYQVMLKNIALNGLKNITPIRAAVAEKSGTTRLYLSSVSVGHSMVRNKHSLKEWGAYQEVRSMTLGELGEVQGYKIDIEGEEYAVFRSAIPDCHIMLLDVHEVPGESVQGLLNRFEDEYLLEKIGVGKVGEAQSVKLIRRVPKVSAPTSVV